jgi:molybdopterin molybdotransferase
VALVSPLLPVDDALAAILARAEPLPLERVRLAEAAGRALAEPAVSLVDLPPFPSSSMDGFALRAADTPGTLRVVGKVAAGRPETRALGEGEAFDISTGGVVPEGADSVVPIERVHVGGDSVRVPEPVPPGANVRDQGGDVRAGATVHDAGARLTPARLAALAACGIGEVAVRRRPRVAIAVTGTELRPPGDELEPGQIYESNGVMIEAALAAAGADVERLGVAEDSEEALEGVLACALEADVVVTSGGVSVGPHDLVRRVVARLGVEEVFWGIAMRPGKPLAFGTRGRTLVFGLPGNPVSSLVGALLFVRPALLALQGDPDPAPPFRPGTLAREVRPRPERDDFVRARVTWDEAGPRLDPILGQESHMIVQTSAADALVHVPRGEEPLPAGSRIRFLWL